MTRTVAGAKVLITGAARGMGRLYAERAVAERAAAVIVWDVDQAALTETADALRAAAEAGTEVVAHLVNLADMGAIAQTAQKVRKEVGDIDLLINNAGIARGKFFWEHDSGEDTRPTMQVNALAPMYITREFLPAMLARAGRPGRIVNIASAAGTLSNPGMSVYAASKSAMIGWSDSLRLELAQQGFTQVKVTTVVLGFVSTGMFDVVQGPFSTPVMSPEYVVTRVWKAMLAGRPMLVLPRSAAVTSAVNALLPRPVRDLLSGL